MLRLVLLCAVVSLVKAQTTNVEQCMLNEGELPVNVYVEGCSTPPCPVEIGQDAVIHLIFKAPYLIRSMETRVVAQVPGIGTLVFQLEEFGVTCNFLTNSFCPILPGEILQYNLSINIPLAAAGAGAFTVNIELYVVDENEKPITCVRVPVSVAA